MELPVRLTIFGAKPVSFESAVVALEPRKISVRSARPLALRTPLKVETPDQLWMGEVVEVYRDGQSWLAVVQVAHALRDIPDLTRLANRFLGKADRSETEAEGTRLSAAP